MKQKGKVYKTVVRPALLYGAETWATTRRQEAPPEVNEMRRLIWMCGVTRRDKIRNEHIRGTTRVVQAYRKIKEKLLKWYGHVRRMKEEHIVRRMVDVEIPGKRRRGRPNLRWKYACTRDMTQAGSKEGNATNRAEWRSSGRTHRFSCMSQWSLVRSLVHSFTKLQFFATSSLIGQIKYARVELFQQVFHSQFFPTFARCFSCVLYPPFLHKDFVSSSPCPDAI